MMSLKQAGAALTIRWWPLAALTMLHRLRAFTCRTGICACSPRKRWARSGSLSPHETWWHWRTRSRASNEPVAPVPRTKIRMGRQLYHKRLEIQECLLETPFTEGRGSCPHASPSFLGPPVQSDDRRGVLDAGPRGGRRVGDRIGGDRPNPWA